MNLIFLQTWTNFVVFPVAFTTKDIKLTAMSLKHNMENNMDTIMKTGPWRFVLQGDVKWVG